MPLYVDSYWFNTCRIMSIPIDTFDHWVSLWLKMSLNTQSYILTRIDIDISHSGSNQGCQILPVQLCGKLLAASSCKETVVLPKPSMHWPTKASTLSTPCVHSLSSECPHIRLERLCKEPILNEAGWTWHGTAEQPWDMKWIETTQRYSK